MLKPSIITIKDNKDTFGVYSTILNKPARVSEERAYEWTKWLLANIKNVDSFTVTHVDLALRRKEKKVPVNRIEEIIDKAIASKKHWGLFVNEHCVYAGFLLKGDIRRMEHHLSLRLTGKGLL